MSEYPITEIAEAAIESAVGGGIATVTQILSSENVSEIISGAVNVLCSFAEVSPKIASEAYNAIVEMTKQAILSKENVVIETIRSKTDVVRMFYERISEAMNKVDFSNTENAKIFNDVAETLIKTVEAACDCLDPPSPFQRLKKALIPKKH